MPSSPEPDPLGRMIAGLVHRAKNVPVAKEWWMALRGTLRAFVELFTLFAVALRVTATVLRVTARLALPKPKGN
jgi:hypothetical protein